MVAIVGQDFRIGPDHAVFFDARGTRIDDKTWTYNVEGGEQHLAIVPTPVSPAIRYCIDSDKRNGQADRVAQIQLSQKSAVFLTLEEVLTPDRVDEVRFLPNRFVWIPRFFFDGYPYRLVVIKDLENDVQTADEDGHPI
ncbi:MAG: hypothetical protein JWN75_154 [Candidatus Saccharibacteria bacterium]|nr:hypothetical protein [Candidatus Saccharibacteria bacterium]